MTDITVASVAYQVEKRSWYLGTADNPGHTISGVLDVSAFTAGTHYPNGYFPSGLALGVITASGKLGPYDNAAADGRQTALGLLFSSVKVPNTADTTIDVGCAVLVAFAAVKLSKLPIALDAAGQTDLSKLYFEA